MCDTTNLINSTCEIKKSKNYLLENTTIFITFFNQSERIKRTMQTRINFYCLTAVKHMDDSCQTYDRHVSDDCPTAVKQQRILSILNRIPTVFE